jgi:hypothetical protein
METHGVPQDALPPEPSSKLIIPPQPGLIEKVVEPTILSIPVFGMVVIWIMVQFRDVFRGDWSDRKQIAKAAAKAERLDKKLAVSDRKVLGVQQMFYNSVPEGGYLDTFDVHRAFGCNSRRGTCDALPCSLYYTQLVCMATSEHCHCRSLHSEVLGSIQNLLGQGWTLRKLCI